MVAAHRLPRRRRLAQPAAFLAVRDRGQASSDSLFVVAALPNGQADARLGLVVSRRVSPRAVVRNRIKRQIRESFRSLEPTLAGLDVVVTARQRAANADNAALRLSLTRHWNTLRSRCAPS